MNNLIQNHNGIITEMSFHSGKLRQDEGTEDFAFIKTSDGKWWYLSRDFVEAAAQGWDIQCPECGCCLPPMLDDEPTNV